MDLFEYAKVGKPAPYFEMRTTKTWTLWMRSLPWMITRENG